MPSIRINSTAALNTWKDIPGDDLIDILGFDIYQGGALKDNTAFIKFFSKELDLLDSIAPPIIRFRH